MKKLIYLSILILTISCSKKDEKPVITKEDPRLAINATLDSSGNLVGVANKNTFIKNEEFKQWFEYNYSNYKEDKETVSDLKLALKGIEIKGFMGTWCSDSTRETPVFYKIMNDISFDNFDMVCLDREKQANGLEKGYKVKYVPTFILYKEGKEIGRFVENKTKGSLEKDLLAIANGKKYTPYK